MFGNSFMTNGQKWAPRQTASASPGTNVLCLFVQGLTACYMIQCRWWTQTLRVRQYIVPCSSLRGGGRYTLYHHTLAFWAKHIKSTCLNVLALFTVYYIHCCKLTASAVADLTRPWICFLDSGIRLVAKCTGQGSIVYKNSIIEVDIFPGSILMII